jgi:hypothetical protein
VENTLTEIGRVTKGAVIGAMKGSGEKAQAIVETTADLVKVTIEGVGDHTAAIQKRVGENVSGAIEATTEV